MTGSKVAAMEILELEEMRAQMGWGSEPLPEPRVTLKVEGKPIDFFLIDTRTQHSILKQPLGF